MVHSDHQHHYSIQHHPIHKVNSLRSLRDRPLFLRTPTLILELQHHWLHLSEKSYLHHPLHHQNKSESPMIEVLLTVALGRQDQILVHLLLLRVSNHRRRPNHLGMPLFQ